MPAVDFLSLGKVRLPSDHSAGDVFRKFCLSPGNQKAAIRVQGQIELPIRFGFKNFTN
jgi:hypothetical protein